MVTRKTARTSNASGRAATPTPCPDCGRTVLRGLDGDRAALVAECDPEEIDTIGELVALALGLRTYTLTRSPITAAVSGWVVDPRYPAAIASGQRKPIVAQHRCGIAIPPAAHKRLPAFTDQPLPIDAPF